MDQTLKRLGVLLLVWAIRVWTGWGHEARPVRDEGRLIQVFGQEMSVDLLFLIKQLEDDAYASDAHMTASDLSDMRERVIVEFRARHPEFPRDIAEAFAWCYTYDYK